VSSCDVVVTGAGGFIGRALIARLASLGVTGVVGVDRDDIDLADSDATRDEIARLRPRTLVHLAASVRRDPSPESERAQWRDTFGAGRNVIEAAAELEIPHLLFAGSADELGDQQGVLDAGTPCRPISVYGLCKCLLQEVADFHARRSTMRVDWFRPFHVYGVGQRGPALVAYAFEAAISGAPAQFTNGLQQRDFVYIDDVVEWIAAGVQAPLDGSGLTVHHLGTGVGTRVRVVLDTIAAEFPSPRFDIGALPRRVGEPDYQVAPPPDQNQTASWPWAPTTSLEEGLARTAAWWHSGAPDTPSEAQTRGA
jgi:nucleoside-diphosphate-sugar epimerase